MVGPILPGGLRFKSGARGVPRRNGLYRRSGRPLFRSAWSVQARDGWVASVDCDPLSVDVASGVQDEECHDVGHVLGSADTSEGADYVQRRSVRDAGHCLGEPITHLGRDQPGSTILVWMPCGISSRATGQSGAGPACIDRLARLVLRGLKVMRLVAAGSTTTEREHCSFRGVHEESGRPDPGEATRSGTGVAPRL